MSDGTTRRDAHFWVTVIGVLVAVAGILIGLYSPEARRMLDRLVGISTIRTDSAKVVVDSAGREDSAQFRIFAEGLDPDLDRTLSRLIADHVIESVAWSPQSWAVVFDGNEVVGHNVPQGLLRDVASVRRAGRRVREVVFTLGGGWAVTDDQSAVRGSGLPPGLREAIDAARTDAEAVNWIRLNHTGGWVLSRGSETTAAGVFTDPRLPDLVHTLSRDALVSLTPDGGHLIVDGQRVLYSRGIPDQVLRQIEGVLSGGGRIRAMTFLDENHWLLLAETPARSPAHAQSALLNTR